MICDKCGGLNPDGASVCNRCGCEIASPPQNNEIPQESYQPQYGQYYPQVFINPLFFLIGAAFVTIAVVTLWLSWMTIDISYTGGSTDKKFSFTDIMDIDEEYIDYSKKLDRVSYGASSAVPQSTYDAISHSFYTMKYCAIAGYILLGVAVFSLLASKRFAALMALLATGLFIAALVGNILYCTKTTDVMDDVYRATLGSRYSSYNIECEISVGLGCILAVIASAGTTVIAFITAFRRNQSPVPPGAVY